MARTSPSQGSEKQAEQRVRRSSRLEKKKRFALRKHELELKAPCWTNSKSRGRKSAVQPRLKALARTRPVETPQARRKPGRKLKQSQGVNPPRMQDVPLEKRSRISLADGTAEHQQTERGSDMKEILPIKHWILHGSWPKEPIVPDPNMSQQLFTTRSFAAISHTDSVELGENPAIYTLEYEELLARAGIFMHQRPGQEPISDDCEKLCVALLDGNHQILGYSLFQGDLFWRTLDNVRSKNEARVMRDITPHLVPSPHFLYTEGALHLRHLNEETKARWTRCISFTGPCPEPDFAIGFASSAFTNEELQKLRSYRAPDRVTSFKRDLYFPFLVCEVECGENGLNVADRQNAHSASIAANAVIQLYRSVPPRQELSQSDETATRAGELHRKILVFSISHDHTAVRIYGHYALIEGDKTTFYRHLILGIDISHDGGKARWASYNFVRNVYDVFAPIHLERIRSVVAQLPDSGIEHLESVTTAENEPQLADSRGTVANASTSQDPTRNVLLTRCLEEQKHLYEWQLGEQKQLYERQLDWMRSHIRQLVTRLHATANTTSANEAMLMQHVEYQRQEIERRKQDAKQEMERQRQDDKQEIDRLKEQFKTLTDLLKQRTSTASQSLGI